MKGLQEGNATRVIERSSIFQTIKQWILGLFYQHEKIVL